MLKFSKNGKWNIYWGDTPLPSGATALGVVTTDERGPGALIHLAADSYFQGIDGLMKDLNQREVVAALARSRAAGALGRVGGKVMSEAKLKAVRENIKLSLGRRKGKVDDHGND